MIIFFLIYTFDPHLKANQRMKVVEKITLFPMVMTNLYKLPCGGLVQEARP
jgi:hypothetical protein